MPGVHPGFEEFQRFAVCLHNFFRGEALDALEAPITEERGTLSHKLIFLVAAVPAFLNLVDPAIRCHNPDVRAQAAIISGPMGINNINLSPIVTTRIGNRAICTVLCLRPATVKILHVPKFCETPAVRAHKYQGIRKKSDPARLVKYKLSLINERFVLVI